MDWVKMEQSISAPNHGTGIPADMSDAPAPVTWVGHKVDLVSPYKYILARDAGDQGAKIVEI